jgi:hypothetical protein
MNKKFLVFLIIVGFLSFMLAACAPEAKPVDVNDPAVQSKLCVRPESDNAYSWSYNSCVDISTTVYALTVQVTDEAVNHTELNAEGSGSVVGTGGMVVGSSSYRMWQDGKGLLPVTIIAINPAWDHVNVGDGIILKTSDLKAMGLPNGAIATFICNEDVEVLSPVQSNQVLTVDRLTYELDDCRMTKPSYTVP